MTTKAYIDRNTSILQIESRVEFFNPRRHRPFRILPRHTGGGGYDPRAVSPLISVGFLVIFWSFEGPIKFTLSKNIDIFTLCNHFTCKSRK